MTNQELRDEIVRSREMSEQRHAALETEIKELRSELHIFKNKAMFFMGSVSVFLAFASDYVKKKLGIL